MEFNYVYQLWKLRHVLTALHSDSSIWQDIGRFKAYVLIARIASDIRQEALKG